MKILGFIWVVLIAGNLTAQIDTTKWYPLSIGNKWQFYYSVSVTESFYITIEVVDDTTINQKKYFILKSWNGYSFQRVEDNSYVYEYNPYSNQEFLRYDFVSSDKSIWNLDSLGGQYGIYLTMKHYIPIFGDSLKSKIYNSVYIDTTSIPPDTLWGPMVDGTSIFISKGVGITVYEQGIVQGYLSGSIINGQTYGTIVSVEKIKNSVLDSYVLFQNYPNPFNPSTTIKYSIPRCTEYYSVQQTTLKIYDVLGREVATLVDKEQKPGSYEVKFNATDLSSGIYFYKITSGSFVKSRKMILMK